MVETCYQVHLQRKSEGGKCTCETYYKCKKCDQTINTKLHTKAHVCHEQYCKTCKDFYSEDHLCYMQPVGSDNQPNTHCHKKEVSQYIFFDFECTQDDRLQCDAGYCPSASGSCRKFWCGSFQHTPNLCVVQKVCNLCLECPVTHDSICIACGKNERIFQGLRTTEDFCKLLFSKENVGATVICHNSMTVSSRQCCPARSN